MQSTLDERPKTDPYNHFEILVKKMTQTINDQKSEFPEVLAALLVLTASTIDHYLRLSQQTIIQSQEQKMIFDSLRHYLRYSQPLMQGFISSALIIANERKKVADSDWDSNVIPFGTK